jgi:hypothetical protein
MPAVGDQRPNPLQALKRRIQSVFGQPQSFSASPWEPLHSKTTSFESTSPRQTKTHYLNRDDVAYKYKRFR